MRSGSIRRAAAALAWLVLGIVLALATIVWAHLSAWSFRINLPGDPEARLPDPLTLVALAVQLIAIGLGFAAIRNGFNERPGALRLMALGVLIFAGAMAAPRLA